MTITNYHHAGTILLWLGVVAVVVSGGLLLMTLSGISIGDPDKLHLHDTYHVQFSGGARLMLILPLLAGIFLIVAGRFVQNQAIEIGAELPEISLEVEASE